MNRILVVEDHEQFSEIMKAFLSSRGFTVELARSGNEAALKIRDSDPFDIAIIDIFLPDFIGLDLTHLLKQYMPQAGILFISGDRSLPLRLKSFSAGGDEYLAKPFSLLELEIRIKRLIQYKSFQNAIGTANIEPKKPELTDTKYYIEGPWLCDISTKAKYVQLSRTQVELFKLLLLNFGKIVSSDLLRSKLRNESSNGLSVAFHRLNYQLEKAKLALKVKAMYGFGYVLQDVSM